MKTLTLGIILILSGLTVNAQRNDDRDQDQGGIQTLFGPHAVSNGGYGSFGAGYSVIDGRDAMVVSARGAWIVNHTIALGFAGSGFINDFQYDPVYNEDVNLTGGYGGLLVEPILFPRSPVHLSFPVVGAVGGIAYTRTSRTYNSWDNHSSWVEDTDTFFLVEPGVELELNIVRFFRLAFGVSYRFTTDIQLFDTPPDALRGLTMDMTFKFGKF